MSGYAPPGQSATVSQIHAQWLGRLVMLVAELPRRLHDLRVAAAPRRGLQSWVQSRVQSWLVVWHGGWHAVGMGAVKKVTVQIPDELLRRAREASGVGTTPTIRQGLELVAASRAYEKLLALRGRVRFSVALADLRRDRR